MLVGTGRLTIGLAAAALLVGRALAARSNPQFHADDASLAPTGPTEHGLDTRSDGGWDMSAAVGRLPVISARDGRRRQPHAAVGAQTGGTRGAQVVSLPVLHGAAPPGLRKRDEMLGVATSALTTRSDVAYYTELQIGNPPQKVRVQVDTGSFELWVNADCGNLTTSADEDFCRKSQRYDPGRSATALPEDQTKELRYGIGSANITYMRDDVSLAGSLDVAKRVRFGVARSTVDQFSGILGIGFGRGKTVPYNNFVDELARQGLTQTKTFGVALGAKDVARGAITFGGVDTSQFAGALAPLPIIPAASSPDGVSRYWVQMRAVSHTPPGSGSGSGSAPQPLPYTAMPGSILGPTPGPGPGPGPQPLPDTAMPVFLDTGATLTLLPDTVVRSMASALGVDVDNPASRFQDQFFRLPCARADQDGSFDFAFDGVTIFVPYQELVRKLEQPGQETICYLGLMPSQKFALLGDTFLRSAYLVFDLDHNMTYMARHASCGSTPETISPLTKLQGMAGRCNESALAQRRLNTATAQETTQAAASALLLDTSFLVSLVGVSMGALISGIV